MPALHGVEEPQVDPQAETTVWERDETREHLFTSLAQSVMVLAAIHVTEDAALNLMHEAGACQLTARRFGTSRPDVLAVRSDEFSREAASHGWMVLPPVKPACLLGEIEKRRPRLVVSSLAMPDAEKLVAEMVRLGVHFVLRLSNKQVHH